MTRGIDHVVLCVNDLDYAREVYTRLGFTLTPRAQHPFGTGNCLAQLGNTFIELLTVVNPSDISEHESGAFSFGAWNRDYLRSRQGMSMLAMTSSDWEDDRKNFTASGLEIVEPFSFSRLARQPDGSDVTVGFDLTFVAPAAEAQKHEAWFTCHHQHPPQYFWKPDYQNHDNGALNISGVYVVSDDVARKQSYVDTLQIDPVNAQTWVLSNSQFAAKFQGEEPESGFAGYRVAVKNLEHTRDVLRKSGEDFHNQPNSVWLGQDAGLGTIIEFVE